jgi:hypothetical protein
MDVFLPDGYPASVTNDYTPYQVYDSFQAFFGTIAGMISSRAVWEGLGVGDSSASPTGAMLIQVIRECMGKLATIVFAHLMGTSIEAECKAYRMAADILTDTAMVLDCMSPWFPSQVRFLVLCLSSILFSAAGVAGNASKSSLSGHFAKWNNLGELNAKEGSQETVISLMGMITGTLVVSWLTTPLLTWATLLVLLGLHLYLNQIGVKSVEMDTLNRQRANIVFSHLIDSNRVMRPTEVSKKERIFEREGGAVFRWKCDKVVGNCHFGASMQTLLSVLGQEKNHSRKNSTSFDDIRVSELANVFGERSYLLWCQSSKSRIPQVYVVLKDGIAAQTQLFAWLHGLLLCLHISKERSHVEKTRMLELIKASLVDAQEKWDNYVERLVEIGWKLDVAVLETSSGTRVRLDKIKANITSY